MLKRFLTFISQKLGYNEGVENERKFNIYATKQTVK